MRMTSALARRLITCGYASMALCLLALVLVLLRAHGDTLSATAGSVLDSLFGALGADANGSATLRSIAGLGVLGCLLAAAGHGILERLRSASAQISDDRPQP